MPGRGCLELFIKHVESLVNQVLHGEQKASDLVLALHVLDQVNDTVGVAHLIVIPKTEYVTTVKLIIDEYLTKTPA